MTLDDALQECERLGIHPIAGGYGAEIALAVVAAGVSAYAAVQQGEQAEAIGKYNQKVAQNQAIAAQQAAGIAADRREALAKRQLAAQRVALASSGVETGTGTPLLLQMDAASQAALDIETIRYGGETQSRGFQASGTLARWEGRMAKRNSYLQATGALLQGVSSAAGSYSRRPSSTGATGYDSGSAGWGYSGQ